MSENIPTYKVVLVGDGGVGKTTLVRTILSGEFEKRYIATLGVEVSPMTFITNKGPITISFWDCAGQEKYGGLRDGYYIQASAAIVMYDVGSKITYRNIPNWMMNLNKQNIPSIIVGNKIDIPNKVKEVNYYSLSVKSGKGVLPLLQKVIRMVTNDEDRIIVEKWKPSLHDASQVIIEKSETNLYTSEKQKSNL